MAGGSGRSSCLKSPAAYTTCRRRCKVRGDVAISAPGTEKYRGPGDQVGELADSILPFCLPRSRTGPRSRSTSATPSRDRDIAIGRDLHPADGPAVTSQASETQDCRTQRASRRCLRRSSRPSRILATVVCFPPRVAVALETIFALGRPCGAAPYAAGAATGERPVRVVRMIEENQFSHSRNLPVHPLKDVERA